MNNTPTPRTDAARFRFNGCVIVFAEEMARLERDLIAARAKVTTMQDALEWVAVDPNFGDLRDATCERVLGIFTARKEAHP